MRRPQEHDEDVRHRKQSKTSRTSQSARRSSHKHEYEKVIIREFIGYAWSSRCRLCGRFQSSYSRFSTTRYMDFRRPESFGKPGEFPIRIFLSLEEISSKIPQHTCL